MAKIEFKAKARPVWHMDGKSVAYETVAVPEFSSRHCDMAAFRNHEKFGGLANSGLFPNVLSRVRRDVFKGRDYFRLDQIPDGVTVDRNGFLAVISFEV